MGLVFGGDGVSAGQKQEDEVLGKEVSSLSLSTVQASRMPAGAHPEAEMKESGRVVGSPADLT